MYRERERETHMCEEIVVGGEVGGAVVVVALAVLVLVGGEVV